MATIKIDETALITDSKQRTWHVMEREGGSVSIYYTKPDCQAHFVVWDELDMQDTPTRSAEIERLQGTLFTERDWIQWGDDGNLQREEIPEDETMRLIGAPMLPGMEE